MKLVNNLRRAAAGLRNGWTPPPPPAFPVRPIRADEAVPGMILTAVGPRLIDRIEPDGHGRYPVITKAEFWGNGECGQPTVYVMGDDDPDGCWPMRPGDMIEVAAERTLSITELAAVLRDLLKDR